MRLTAITLSLLAVLLLGSVQAYADTIFYDFNNGNTNGWAFPYDPSRSQGPGLWSVENGTLIQRYFGDGNAGLLNNLLISNQVIETQVKTQGYAGVVFWYQANGFVVVDINRGWGKIWVTEWIDGIGYSYPYDYWISGDTWYGLKVDANSTSGELAVYLDDVLLFTHLASTTYRSGTSGLWSGNEVAYFDNFRLTSDNISSVPEPSILLLLSLGLVALIGCGWRHGRG